MSVFSWFKKAFKNIFEHVKAFIQSDAVKDLFKEELGKITQGVVAELSQANFTDLSNDEKRKEAFNRIKSTAAASGIEFRDGIVGLLIELAVQRLKK